MNPTNSKAPFDPSQFSVQQGDDAIGNTALKEMYDAWKASGIDDPAQWAWGEMTRLREIEARGAAMAAKFSELGQILAEAPELNMLNYSEDQVAELNQAMISAWGVLNGIDADESLSRRDKICRLDGAIGEVERLIRNMRESATVAAQNHSQHAAIRHNYDADLLELRLNELYQQIREARVGK